MHKHEANDCWLHMQSIKFTGTTREKSVALCLVVMNTEKKKKMNEPKDDKCGGAMLIHVSALASELIPFESFLYPQVYMRQEAHNSHVCLILNNYKRKGGKLT